MRLKKSDIGLGYHDNQVVYKWLINNRPKMSDLPSEILNPWEVQTLVENLAYTELEDIGTKKWLEFHKDFMLLNQQCVLEINSLQEEKVKDNFVTHRKIPNLIHEAISISVWKEKVFPTLVNENELNNTFLLYSVLYHEETAVSLLESVLYHSDSIESINDSVIDLIDYSVEYVTKLLFSQKKAKQNVSTHSCLEEIVEKKNEIEFDIGLRSISILRYLAEFSDKLPLSALSRLLSIHDVPFLFVQLMEFRPWKRNDKSGEIEIYCGNWEKVKDDEFDKVSKYEAQVLFGLRELMLNPKCSPYYELTGTRISFLSKLQKYLTEQVLDQLEPLLEFRRWLACLNVTAQTPVAQKPVSVEMIPEIKSSIVKKYEKRWKKLARHQAKTLLTTDAKSIQKMASILNDAYNADKLEILESKKCFNCQAPAKSKCSKCREAWYCGRGCQVNDWTKHKVICDNIVKAREKSSKIDE